MLTLNDWLIRKLLAKVIKKAFYNKFGYDLKLDLKNVSIDHKDDNVVLGIVASAQMKESDANDLIDELV